MINPRIAAEPCTTQKIDRLQAIIGMTENIVNATRLEGIPGDVVQGLLRQVADNLTEARALQGDLEEVWDETVMDAIRRGDIG